ncbi:MAG TPA: PEP/pyruvate-binding domain-containing protein [Acidiferrobacterales bacterium]|nr:PEP/pyruvate-binding domain-containing protein [Acidiferrobacterales bacterium]
MEQLVIPLSAPEATDAGRFGPKAANLAILGRAGLPIPDGFCLDAQAYRIQVSALGLEASAREAFATDDRPQARRCALAMRLGLLDQPIVPAVLDPLVAAWRTRVPAPAALSVVRSSALVEDRYGSSFAGQFESFLGLESEVEFVTAVRSCWAALWSTRALRYMATHDLNPAETAMALLVQPLVAARASGGGLSQTADGGMRVSATWGLGSAIAQGEVTPDRFELSRDGALLHVAAGRKDHSVGCVHRQEPTAQAVPRELVTAPCLNATQAVELGRLLRKVEDIMGMPVEIEWALDDTGFKLLQARPLHMQPAQVPDEIWLRHPRLNGHPAGVGWGTGRACVVNCECELTRVGPGDVLVTRVAGPALSQVLPRVAGVVAELGGSTSHLAALARERGIPMVLGVLDATQHIPDGVQVAVDGVAGVVRWIR